MKRRLADILILAAIGLVPGGPAFAQFASTSARDTTAADPPDAEVRDAILLLESGPIHIRMRVTLGGKSLAEARADYVERLITSMDENGDGKLTRDEADRSPLLATKRRPKAAAFIESLGGRQLVDRGRIEQSVLRVGGEPFAYRQDTTSSETDRGVFDFLDADGSGVVDAPEVRDAAERIIARDRDGDDCVSFSEFQPEPVIDPNAIDLIADVEENIPTATFATMLRDTRQPYLPRALVREYDRNRNKKLDPAELGWKPERIAGIDTDGSGDLDETELKAIGDTPADLEVDVELDPEPGREALVVRSALGDAAAPSKRPDYVRVQFPTAEVAIAFRNIDPIQSTVTEALDLFNRLDADQNGYLDTDETSGRIRFERGLFDAMDGDGDGKVFGEEMEHWVRVRSEPSASSCRVNIYDTGRGFFQALDRNGDGLISVRERREAIPSLVAMDRNEDDGITPDEPNRNFQIEFVRGRYQLFGRTDQLVAMTPEFNTFTAVGPIWFVRMDRNNDGDLTWDEFLGSRFDFDRIDTDRDGLVDPREAEAATPREEESS